MVLANLTPFTCYFSRYSKTNSRKFYTNSGLKSKTKMIKQMIKSNICQICVSRKLFPPQILVASSHMVLIRISHEYLIHLEVHYRLHCTTHPFWLIAIPRQPWQRHLFRGGPFLVAEGYRGRTKRGKRTVCQTSGCRLEAGGFRSDIVDIDMYMMYLRYICRMRYML